MTQDDDRRRLARRLHSVAGQQLAALQMNLSMISPAALSEREARAFADSVELAQACMREIQELMAELHPPLLEAFGLLPALQALAADHHAAFETNLAEGMKLPPALEIGVYRMVEETIRDRTEPIRVSLTRARDQLEVRFENVGESPASLAERLAHLGGRRVYEKPTLTILLPITDAEA